MSAGRFSDVTAALPGSQVNSVEEMRAAGQREEVRRRSLVVTGTHRGEFAGLKPTGRRVEVTEINISRFRDGLMLEHWALLDEASMMRQLAGR